MGWGDGLLTRRLHTHRVPEAAGIDLYEASIASNLIPGVRWKRHLFFRYSHVWTKPR